MAEQQGEDRRWPGVPLRLRALFSGDSAPAALLLAATVTALLWANSPWGASYDTFWGTELRIGLGDMTLAMDLQHWVNDGLMALFFFVIGLEVRREFAMGELTDTQRARVPMIAALAGLAVPALVFLAFNPSGEAAAAWGVVISTDTAFLLGVLALMGPVASPQLRVFLLTLAVADDVGALAIIAIFYTDDLALGPLAVAVVGLVAIHLLARFGQWRGGVYLLVAAAVWLTMYLSGVHPTIAGVLIALLMPVYPPRRDTVEDSARLARRFRQSPNPAYARTARQGMDRAVSVNERLQHLYAPTTSFVVVPLFALANAGVRLDGDTLTGALGSTLTWGVVAGLVLGKLVGITAAAAAATRLRMGVLQPGLDLPQIAGGAALSGIGFTISLFIVDLALDDPVLADQARVGVLLASVLAITVGTAIFRVMAYLRDEDDDDTDQLLDAVDPARDHIRGPIDAPLTLVEYADFECPFCGKATGSAVEVRKHFGARLRYVFRHLPMEDLHPHALQAAEASEAAAVQGRFWEMHDRLFQHADALGADDLPGHAAAIGLDVDRFEEDLRTRVHLNRVHDDARAARTGHVGGTPTFFIGDRRHRGPWDAESLIAALEAADPVTAEATGSAG